MTAECWIGLGVGFIISGIFFWVLISFYVPRSEVETIAREKGMIYESQCRVLTNKTQASEGEVK